MKRRRWAVFVSGRGSNLRSLLQKNRAQISLVVSSKPDAIAVQVAKRFGVPVEVISKETPWGEVIDLLNHYRVTNIFLAGFMRIVPEELIHAFPREILNVHPSMLPLFPGLKAMEKSFDSEHPMGVTVHEVVPEVDAGKIVFQKESVAAGAQVDWPLAQLKTHLIEQQLVTKAMRLYGSDREFDLSGRSA